MDDTTANNIELFQPGNVSTEDFGALYGSYQQHWHNASVSSAAAAGTINESHHNSHTSSNTSTSSPEQQVAVTCYQGSSKDDPFSLPGTSPNFDGNRSSNSIFSDHLSGSDNDTEERPRKKRFPVPVDKKDDKYWERRRKNNIAAKRSREMKRQKVEDELYRAKEAIQENQKLKQEIEVLKAEINSLRRLLKDANMTLSLWIRARQTSDSPSQLPPMLRNPGNMPFVTFPVTSTSTM